MLAALGSIGGLFGLNPLTKGARLLGGALALLMLLGVLGGLKACYDRSVVERAVSKSNVKVLEKKGKADVKATEQRATDKATIQQQREEIRDAVENADTPSGKRNARLCTILRQQTGDKAAARHPACGGPPTGR